MRNLGGAIGIALIDTIIYTRSEPLTQQLWQSLQDGNLKTAEFVGAPLATIEGHTGAFDPQTAASLDGLVQTAATVQALNEAWMIVAIITFVAVVCLPFAKPAPQNAVAGTLS
jgi:DHA2 family multidrug resistance protein